ncbi:hypothetical protein [Gelidibacter japonicus]|uniref:hypothetical protein n=1 Tax=Gelidibacter japonicus TaxID=1962232 RepID=UPI002AFF8EC4|nr:hypothetical protein [Gelidibacter japonicus]
MELSKFVSEVEKHLKNPTGFIAVTQGTNKLTKPNVNKNKYNFALQDVLAMAPNVETFIKQLPQYGFSDGATMTFRLKRGASTHLLSETTLKFGSQQLAAPIQPQEQSVAHQATPTLNPPTPMQYQSPAPTMPQPAMGFTQVPSHEWISLKVKEERHADLIERLNKAEKDRDKAESELRMEKEKTFGLERKLDTIADRHELAMERLEKDRKSFLETEAGKEVIGLAGRLPEMIQALKPNQPQIGAGGMANPLANASAAKQTFAQELINYPDEVVPLLQQVAYHTMNTDGFHEALVNQLGTMSTE